MRILVVSNLYPPYYIGGYELGCQQVVEALKQQGHQVKVLTSSYGIDKPVTNGNTYRWLKIDLRWLGPLEKYSHFPILQKERRNQAAFRHLCRDLKPDVVYIWNAANISMSVVYQARRRNIPIVYYVSDNWLSVWEIDAWFSWCQKNPASAGKKALKALSKVILNVAGIMPIHGPLDLRHVQFTSQFTKDQTVESGKPVADGEVVHWGVDADVYACNNAPRQPLRLLYVGQTRPPKGIYTALDAFAHLKALNQDLPITLTVAGGSVVREEEAALREYVRSLGLENTVIFTGLLPRSELLPIYQSHDILIFPSIFDEPFSITLLEGLSSGLAVVGTTTGGSREILQNEVNSLTFPAGDALACAGQIQRLLDEPALFEKIRCNGRQTIVDKFQFQMMMDKIIRTLQAA